MLSSEQIEEMCELAEESARNYILSKIPPRGISDLTIVIETVGRRTITVNVDVNVAFSPLFKNFDVEKLVKEAVNIAFETVESFLRRARCRSMKLST